MIALEGFHGMQGFPSEIAVGPYGMTVAAGVAEAGKLGLQGCHCLAADALVQKTLVHAGMTHMRTFG